jgi:hypothetical protein
MPEVETWCGATFGGADCAIFSGLSPAVMLLLAGRLVVVPAAAGIMPVW